MYLLDVAKIQSLRRAKGESQKEASSKIGISESLLAMVETGRKTLSADDLKRVADYLEVTTDSLYKQ